MIEIYSLNDFNKENFSNFDIICALGNFDGLHLGHQKIFSEMKEFSKNFQNPKLVLITFTPNTKLFFYPENNFLISPEEEKSLLADFFSFDIIINISFNDEFKSISPNEFIEEILIKKIGPKALFVGKNFSFGREKSGNVDFFHEYKKFFDFFDIPELEISKIISSNEKKKISSSMIRKLIYENGDIALANQLLGHQFFIKGNVISGFKRGKTIGFPTANIIPSSQKILPKFGVYSTSVLIFEDQIDFEKNFCKLIQNKDKLKAISNFGIKPTFSDSETKNPLLETHIIDFNQDLYGKTLVIFFENFIREEKKFNSIDDLKKQIQEDLRKIL